MLMCNRQRFRLILTTVAALVAFLITCTGVYSQLSMSPPIVELEAYPGGLETFTLSVGNGGDQSVACTMQVSAMRMLGGIPAEADDAPRSCKDWIAVQPETFVLKPNTGKRVVCRLRVPKEVIGGYYAIVSCLGSPEVGREQAAVQEGIGAAVRFSHRMLAVVMVTVQGANLQAVIEAAEPMLTQGAGGRGYTLQLPVRNLGNAHARIGGTVEIRSEGEQLLERFPLEAGRGFILPEHERLFKSKGIVNLPDGLYMAKIRLDVDNSRRPMQNAFPFYVRDGQPDVTELTDEQKKQLKKESAGFAVSAPQVRLELPAGARRTQPVELVNLTKEILRVQASPMEWYRTADGQDVVLANEPAHGRSAKELLSLRQYEIELRPLGRRRLPLTVALPAGATGERYAAVSFDRADAQLDASPRGMARRSVMVRVLAKGTGVRAAEITKFDVTRKPNGAFMLTMRFQNTGNVSIDPDVRFTITDENGGSLGKTTPAVHPPLVQAGGEGLVRAEWSKVLDPGRYTAQLTLRFGPNDPPIVRRAVFVVPAEES